MHRTKHLGLSVAMSHPCMLMKTGALLQGGHIHAGRHVGKASCTECIWPSCSVDIKGTFEAKGVHKAAERLKFVAAEVREPFPASIRDAGRLCIVAFWLLCITSAWLQYDVAPGQGCLNVHHAASCVICITCDLHSPPSLRL